MARRKPNKNRKQVKRQTRHFQLRVEHPIDQHVREILDFKRANRAEVTTIRDGVRLIWALENNDLSVLFELFPHIKPQLTPTPPAGGVGGSDLAKEIAAQIILQGGTPGYLMQSALPAPAPQPEPAAPATPAPTTGKLLSGFKPLAAPTFEDEELLEVTASTKGTAAQNFMRMLGSL